MKKPKLSELKYKIEVTDWQDTPTGEAATKSTREVLFEAYAMVEQLSSHAIHSYRVNVSDRDKPTHMIIFREPCDFEVTPSQFISREYKGRRERFKVLMTREIEDCFLAVTAALWRRDSDKLDPETQDIPEYDEGPDGFAFDMRSAGW